MNPTVHALILVSPPLVEVTPGFVAFITGLLANREINIVKFISCSNNMIIFLDSKDALNAFSLLHNYTKERLHKPYKHQKLYKSEGA